MRRWQNKLGFKATYGKLLELFEQAGHAQCAEALCQVLKKKCELSNNESHLKLLRSLGDKKSPQAYPAPAHIVSREEKAPHMMFCKEKGGLPMQSRHLVWYGKVSIHVQHWHVLVY